MVPFMVRIMIGSKITKRLQFTNEYEERGIDIPGGGVKWNPTTEPASLSVPKRRPSAFFSRSTIEDPSCELRTPVLFLFPSASDLRSARWPILAFLCFRKEATQDLGVFSGELRKVLQGGGARRVPMRERERAGWGR